jgi:hypothetical protein
LTSLDSHLSSFGEALLKNLALFLDAPFDYLVPITVPIGEPYSKNAVLNLAIPGIVFRQVPTGAITGFVMDNTGARIRGASVTITAFNNPLGAELTRFETKKVMATTGGCFRGRHTHRRS